MFRYHILALLIGTILDFFIGDPHSFWHPVKVIGNWISFLDRFFLGEDGLVLAPEEDRKKMGYFLVVLVVIPVFFVTAFLTFIFYKITPFFGVIFEAIVSCYCLAGKSLYEESKEVLLSYFDTGIEGARHALSMIVGRDTAELSLEEILKATIETIAENASDGVIAPFFYLFLFGPVGGMVYKAINTMDSMVGYHNDRYEEFGYAAANLDDYANFIPSRLTGLLVVFVSKYSPVFVSYKNAKYIFMRDRLNHKSPNSAQSEAAFAGALQLQLGGGASYFGKFVEKPTIGDADKNIEINDVRRAHELLFHMCLTCQIFLLILLLFS